MQRLDQLAHMAEVNRSQAVESLSPPGILVLSLPQSKIKNRAVLSPPMLSRTSSSKLSENIISLVVVTTQVVCLYHCPSNPTTMMMVVVGAFRHLIPVQALEEQEDLQRGRGRQGLLPDFRMELPTPLGQSASQLAELKVIGAAGSCYPRSGPCARRKRGVERRAAKLPGEYRRPLEKLDRRYHGVQQGPLV